MTSPKPVDWRAFGAKWGSLFAMALLIAYSAHPMLTFLLQVADGAAERVGDKFMPLLLGGLILTFGIAVCALLPQADALLRVETGCRWSGILLWITIPLMVVIIWQQTASNTGADESSATAAFFLLMIFGTKSAVLGGVLLLVALFIRKRRLAAAEGLMRG